MNIAYLTLSHFGCMFLVSCDFGGMADARGIQHTPSVGAMVVRLFALWTWDYPERARQGLMELHQEEGRGEPRELDHQPQEVRDSFRRMCLVIARDPEGRPTWIRRTVLLFFD